MVIRISWGCEDGAPLSLYNKRTDLYHSEMPCATFNLSKAPLARKPSLNVAFPFGTFRTVSWIDFFLHKLSRLWYSINSIENRLRQNDNWKEYVNLALWSRCAHFILSIGQKVSYLCRSERLAEAPSHLFSVSEANVQGVPPRLRQTFVFLDMGMMAGSHAQVCAFTHPLMSNCV